MRSLGRDCVSAMTTSRYLAPDLLRGLAMLLLVLTNVPLILSTIRYLQVSGLSPHFGGTWNDLAVTVFFATPTITDER